MTDLVDVIQKVGYALDIGYWVIELENRTVYWPKGLGRPADQPGESGYAATSLDRILAMIDEADQGLFRGFLSDILSADGADRVIEIGVTATWGGHARVRLAGRKVGHGKESRIIGLLEVISRWKETERLAKSLGHIVEALFISSDAGIVLFDADLRVSRLNRNALELFAVTDADEADGNYSAAIEAKLPVKTRDLLKEAIATSSAVSGTLSLGGLGEPRLSWRANPWGDGDASGVVMVFSRPRLSRAADIAEIELRQERPIPPPTFAAVPTLPPPPAAHVDEPPESRHRALEWVKHPIVLVSISTGEIAYANRHAREFYHLPTGKRWFVENLYDVSGFTCYPDPLAIVAAGGHVLRLKLGARVGRMFDYDDDLLFIEYHADVVRPRIVPPTAHTPPADAAARSAVGNSGR
jgi:PAS domain-containing protein